MVHAGDTSLEVPGFIMLAIVLLGAGIYAFLVSWYPPRDVTSEAQVSLLEGTSDSNGSIGDDSPLSGDDLAGGQTSVPNSLSPPGDTQSFISMRKVSSNNSSEAATENANGISTFRLAWSLMAASAGAWVFFAPPTLAARVGPLAAVSYPLGVCLPLVLMVFLSPLILANFPAVNSLAEFLEHRFKSKKNQCDPTTIHEPHLSTTLDLDIQDHYATSFPGDETLSAEQEKSGCCSSISSEAFFYHAMLGVVSLVLLTNIFLSLAAEYTSLGDLVEYVFCVKREVVVVLVGLVTIAYTMVGGLTISIKTDQIQGFVAVSLFFVISAISCYIYFAQSSSSLQWDAITSSLLLHEEPTFDTEEGWNSLFILPISISASTLLNEMFWQRAWGAKSQSSLQKAVFLSSVCVCAFAAVFAIFGYLGALSSAPLANTNLSLFALLDIYGSSKENPKGDGIPSIIWLGIIPLVAFLSQSSLDSYQNGLASIVATSPVSKLLHSALKGRKVSNTGNLNNNSTISGDSSEQVGDAPIPELPSDSTSQYISPHMLRLSIFIANILAVIVSLCGLNVVSLFLTANMISLSLTPLVVIGVMKPFFQSYTVSWAFFSPILGFCSLFTFGFFTVEGDFSNIFSQFLAGVQFSLYDNYTWKPFFIMLGASTLTSVCGIVLNRYCFSHSS